MGAPLISAEMGGGGGTAAAGGASAAAGANPYVAAGLAAFQVWSSFQQAEMTRAAGELNAAIGEMNAKYAEEEAWEAEQYGFTLSSRYQTEVDKVLSDQVTGFAQQGVDFTQGSARQLREQTRLNAMLNKVDIEKQARKKAYGLKIEASNMRLGSSQALAQAELDASAIERSGVIRALETGVSGYYRGAK